MSTLLQVTDAHVAYGKVEAVRSVSLEVGDNEIVTIVGANGAGKTTLLNAIMGILPLKGRVSFAGAGHGAARDRGSRRGGPEPGAGTSRTLRHHECRGQSAARRVPDREGRRRKILRAGLHAVSAAEGAAQATSRHAVGRRAADAGHGPRFDGRAEAVDAGRAESRVWRRSSSPIFSAPSASCAPAASRSCWSSRTPKPRCKSPTAPM